MSDDIEIRSIEPRPIEPRMNGEATARGRCVLAAVAAVAAVALAPATTVAQAVPTQRTPAPAAQPVVPAEQPGPAATPKPGPAATPQPAPATGASQPGPVAQPQPAPVVQPPAPAPAPPPATETNCSDGRDDDGDTVYDCGDADCAADAACKSDGSPEASNQRCSDWVDNDGDGYIDCDDEDCGRPGISVCQGSWDRKSAVVGDPAAAGSVTLPGVSAGTSPGVGPGAGPGAGPGDLTDDVPDLGAGMTVEDLIGKGGDIDGERNDVVCADGIDNDGDGRIDCADFGCRFDPTVTVCQGSPEFRFSVVARAEVGRQMTSETIAGMDPVDETIDDARFSTLQLRAFGPMPYVQDSFFLLSLRAERTPRLTFAMFQVPIGNKGFYLNVNSGGGGLSNALVRSAHKQLLLVQPFYVYNAFEQGNGGAVEIGGPLDTRGRFLFRGFVAGGSGRFNGNVGGTFIADDNTNFTYGVGAQLHVNLIGYYSRWDSPFLYRRSPLTAALEIGVKYDQRAQERYPAVNTSAVLRYDRFVVIAENYTKRELEFESWQTAYNIQVGFLAIPKRLLLAADFGEFLVGEMDNPPDDFETDLRRQLQETQWRAAAHVYLWRNIFLGSLIYTDRRVDPDILRGQESDQVEREIKLVGQYRF